MPDLTALVTLLRLATKGRAQLVLENIALRHQLAVYKLSVGRPNITDRDRIFWLTIMRMLRQWREALVIVQPETVIKWHRNGFRHYWRRMSRGKPGRPRAVSSAGRSPRDPVRAGTSVVEATPRSRELEARRGPKIHERLGSLSLPKTSSGLFRSALGC